MDTVMCIPQVRPSDLDRYKLPAQCRLQLTEHDRKMGEELLQEAFVQRHPEWVKELQIMLKSGEKAEIQVHIFEVRNSYQTL
jgi:meiotic recombination protein SPO11